MDRINFSIYKDNLTKDQIYKLSELRESREIDFYFKVSVKNAKKLFKFFKLNNLGNVSLYNEDFDAFIKNIPKKGECINNVYIHSNGKGWTAQNNSKERYIEDVDYILGDEFEDNLEKLSNYLKQIYI